ETFSEDPLRMLRAARFVAQLDFALVDGVMAAIKSQASRIQILSTERVSEELRRLVTSAYASKGFAVLLDGGILHRILPELMAMIGVDQGGYHIYDVYGHTMATVDAAPRDFITR